MEDSSPYSNINLSAVLSLKTELLRKKKDVSEQKNSQTLSRNYDVKCSELKYRNNTSSNDQGPSESKRREVLDDDKDENILAKSQKILHAKAELYDRMIESNGVPGINNSLIAFERKSSLNLRHRETDFDDTDGDNQIEYVDEYGRTRKCSLEEYKRMQNEKCSLDSKDIILCSSEKSNDGFHKERNDFVDSDKEQEIRMKWQQKTAENAHKEEVHYQDVFFDEARLHGVGYYSFSTDDKERLRQQKELESIRQKTLQEQKHRYSQKAKRDAINAKRVLAAKNRKRARLGLPPLEEIETEEDKKDDTNDIHEKDTNSSDSEEEERVYNRPWDKNKVKSDWFVKSEKLPYSQEEWNERKRNERNAEFAPPQQDTITKRHSNSSKSRNSLWMNSTQELTNIESTIEAKLNKIRNARY